MEKGIIQVYTGDGKGKTTAAIGQLVRAHGAGLNVALIQFLKGVYSGELNVLKYLRIPFWQFGTGEFIIDKPSTRDIDLAREGLKKAEELFEDYDLLVLDELSYLLTCNIIPMEDIIDLLERKPDHLELVLTGREMPKQVLSIASLVTRMEKVKHPYDEGINARKGIEY